jgi:class 3 adenylate cyclase
VAISCHACSAELRDGARFCDACGSPVVVTDSHAEYKQVTVLFADVVHSMDIAAAVGAERLREIMGDLLNRSSKVVQRYGGTVDKFTGDGIMAVFGAPIALEDHAVRACRAALDIHKDLKGLATTLEASDGIKLELRVGLNSGEVIAGEIGSGPLGYTAIGQQVGMAQRMESVATPGGVMVSESTARLVENAAILGDAELVRIKGADEPVPARRLLAIATGRGPRRVETSFVGRERELGALRGLLDRAIDGNGSVVGVVGLPGIGKSRLVREITSRATNEGVEVFTAYCESHTTDLPFHAAAGLIRSATGSSGLDDADARAQVRARYPNADEEDLLILEDLLGIGDPAAHVPQIDPDARRRRLVAMVNAAALARSTPTVYVIEDTHWIDGVSESMLADFLSVVPRTRSLVIVTYRPEYVGALGHAPRSQTIALKPLDDPDMSQLSTELLGNDRSVTGLADLVADRAAGNPFFAEEIVRDLTERDVLIGGRGCYLCLEPATDVSVPSTLHAVIAARIDRLDPAAKRALNAAAVIGSQFGPDMLKALEIDPLLDDLVHAELIDQIAFSPHAEYAFRHPLIRAVAYESQLKSDRARVHRRLAAAIEQVDQNAALIAEHWEAAGDLHGAYEWHMRAAAWAANRDIATAQNSWWRARQVADLLPEDDPDRAAMRIAPRTLLCTSAWRVGGSGADTGFDELRELCHAAGDQTSLAVGMSGQVLAEFMKAHRREASRLATEHTELLESIGDPTLIVGPFIAAIAAKHETGEMAEVLRLAQRVIDVAGADRTEGNLILGSPLAWALAMRGAARWCLGIPGWKDDFAQAAATARAVAPTSLAFVIFYTYVLAIPNGALLPDATALRDTTDALAIAEQSGDEMALRYARGARGVTLAHRGGPERGAGFELLGQIREASVQQRFALVAVPVVDIHIAEEKARSGDLDGAIGLARKVVDDLFDAGGSVWSVRATAVLVEALLRRGGDADLRDAQAELDRLVDLPFDPGLVLQEVWLLRLRARVAQARGDEVAYRDFRDRYRAMATQYGFEGHMAWAAAMD